MAKAVVYAIAAPENFIKFGVASNPAKRLLRLQTESPIGLILLAHSTPIERKDAFRLEWTIHRAVLSYHVRGEWFRCSPKTLAVVDLLKRQPAEKVFDLMTGWARDEWVGALRHAGGVRIDGAFRKSGHSHHLI